jgi:hypothetical protein
MSALLAVLLAAETILVVPLARKADAPPAAGVAAAEAILDVVVQTNQDRFLTLQQLAAELGRRNLRLDDPALPAREVARALGATEMVEGEIWLQEGRWRIEARRLKVADWQQAGVAREEGSRGALPALGYKAGLDLFPAHLEPGPLTGSAAALEQAALCELQLAGQPLRAKDESTVSRDLVAAAQRACRAAMQSDSRMGLARAGWALTLAARGRLGAARKQAKRAGEKRFVPLATLVEAYATERMGDPAGWRSALSAAVEAHPGFLQARSYLAEPQVVQGDRANR